MPLVLGVQRGLDDEIWHQRLCSQLRLPGLSGCAVWKYTARGDRTPGAPIPSSFRAMTRLSRIQLELLSEQALDHRTVVVSTAGSWAPREIQEHASRQGLHCFVLVQQPELVEPGVEVLSLTGGERQLEQSTTIVVRRSGSSVNERPDLAIALGAACSAVVLSEGALLSGMYDVPREKASTRLARGGRTANQLLSWLARSELSAQRSIVVDTSNPEYLQLGDDAGHPLLVEIDLGARNIVFRGRREAIDSDDPLEADRVVGMISAMIRES